MLNPDLMATLRELAECIDELHTLTMRTVADQCTVVTLINALHDRMRLIRRVTYRLHRHVLPALPAEVKIDFPP